MEIVNITLDENSADFAIAALTDQYTKPLESIIRELTNNALDATVDIPNPVIKYTQTEQDITIQDNGCGMSLDFIKNTYSKYWGSSKREDNTAIGAYGLGSKSPLLACNAFLVDTTTASEHTLFEVSKEGGYHLKIFKHEIGVYKETGTKITLPLSDPGIGVTIRDCCLNPRRPGVKMYLNGKEVNPQWEVIGKITNNNGNAVRVYLKKNPATTFFAIQPLSYTVGCTLYSKDASLASEVAIETLPGELNFNLSRDSLIFDQKYQEYTSDLHKLVVPLINRAIINRPDAGRFFHFAKTVAAAHPEKYDAVDLVLAYPLAYSKYPVSNDGLEVTNKRALPSFPKATLVDCTGMKEGDVKLLTRFVKAKKRLFEKFGAEIWFVRPSEKINEQQLIHFFGIDKARELNTVTWEDILECLKRPQENKAKFELEKVTLLDKASKFCTLADVIAQKQPIALVVDKGCDKRTTKELLAHYAGKREVYFTYTPTLKKMVYTALTENGIDVELVIGKGGYLTGKWAEGLGKPWDEVLQGRRISEIEHKRQEWINQVNNLLLVAGEGCNITDDVNEIAMFNAVKDGDYSSVQWEAVPHWDSTTALSIKYLYLESEAANQSAVKESLIAIIKAMRLPEPLNLSYPVN